MLIRFLTASRARAGIIAALILLHSACAEPAIEPTPCNLHTDCLEGEVCSNGLCRAGAMDAGVADRGTADGQIADSGRVDGLRVDSATSDLDGRDSTLGDLRAPDTASPDLRAPDGASPDLRTPDAALPDLRTPDAALPDLRTPDASSPDLLVRDAASPDLAAPDAGWFLASHARRRAIALMQDTSVSEPGFPLLVALDPSRIDFAATQADGADLRFVDAMSGALLAHELDSWSLGTSATIWVKLPSLDGAASSVIAHMYYSDDSASDAQQASAVWSEGYTGVWHLGAGLQDSTANANHCASSGSRAIVGAVGPGRGLSSGDYLCCGNSVSLSVTDQVTVEVWVRVAEVLGDWHPVVTRGDFEWGLKVAPSGPFLFATFDNDWDAVGSDVAAPVDQWVYLVGKLDAGAVTIFVDGVEQLDTDVSLGLQDSHDQVCLGRNADIPSRVFIGDLDEVRFSPVSRSGAWIAVQHLSMTDALISIGPEELRP